MRCPRLQDVDRHALWKAATWQVLSLLMGTLLLMVMTGESLVLDIEVMIANVFMEVGMFYMHERMWDRYDSKRAPHRPENAFVIESEEEEHDEPEVLVDVPGTNPDTPGQSPRAAGGGRGRSSSEGDAAVASSGGRALEMGTARSERAHSPSPPLATTRNVRRPSGGLPADYSEDALNAELTQFMDEQSS